MLYTAITSSRDNLTVLYIYKQIQSFIGYFVRGGVLHCMYVLYSIQYVGRSPRGCCSFTKISNLRIPVFARTQYS